MPDAGGAILRRGNPRAAVAGECIPGGIRAAFECDDRAGAPMGTRRKTAERGFVEITDSGGAEGVAGGGLRGQNRSLYTDSRDRKVLQMEVRWMILSADGRHSWMGRHTDPSQEEITRAADQLQAQAIQGWLCVLRGDYWDAHDPLEVMEVSNLYSGDAQWLDVLAAFKRRRTEALSKTV
jgi:hypothetical protein